jgi:tetratricopeptide (TPR) repeat protein
MIGIFIIVAWGLADLIAAYLRWKPVVVVTTTIWLVVLAALSYRQVGYWADKVTLFRHTTDVFPQNHVARLYLGSALRTAGRPDLALLEFDRAIELGPDMYQGHQHKGLLLYESGRYGEAAHEFARAVRLSRERMRPEAEYAAALLAAKIFATHPDDSVRNGAAAIEMAEHACEMTGYQFVEALDVLGMAYANAGRYRQAITRAVQAHELYVAANDIQGANQVAERIRLYRQGQPYRETPQTDAQLPRQESDD